MVLAGALANVGRFGRRVVAGAVNVVTVCIKCCVAAASFLRGRGDRAAQVLAELSSGKFPSRVRVRISFMWRVARQNTRQHSRKNTHTQRRRRRRSLVLSARTLFKYNGASTRAHGSRSRALDPGDLI